MKYIISITIIITFIGAIPRFRDFNQANFFYSVKEVMRSEKNCLESQFISKDFDKDYTGILTYKHENLDKEKYYLIEYHFIKNAFCKGVQKIFFKTPLYNKEDAVERYKENKELYIKAYSQPIYIANDTVYEKNVLLVNNNLRYKNLIILILIKSDSVFIPTEIFTPLLEDSELPFWHK